MKNFKVTVNGNTYDVSVEEVAGGLNTNTASIPSTPQVKIPSQESSSPVPKPVSSSSGTKVVSPMPGTILDIKVAVGDIVKQNQVVAVLEAMKMENEIVTPVAGTVVSINVNKSASVDSGDILITVAE